MCERVPLPPPSGSVLNLPEIPSPIFEARVGGTVSSPLSPGFLSILRAVWNRAVLCSLGTRLKNVRNVELYFPPLLPFQLSLS